MPPCRPSLQGRSIKLDALAGVNLRLPVKWDVIGVFSDHYLRDQRFGRKAALDNPCGSLGLHNRAFAGTAAIARPACHQHAERRRHDVEAFGDIFADLVERAAAAGTALVGDVDDLFDAFKMGRQSPAVDLAGPLCRLVARLVPRKLGRG